MLLPSAKAFLFESEACGRLLREKSGAYLKYFLPGYGQPAGELKSLPEIISLKEVSNGKVNDVDRMYLLSAPFPMNLFLLP